MSPCCAVVKEVKSDWLVTVNVSVNATPGNVDVARCPLLSNTGTSQLDVPTSFVDAVPSPDRVLSIDEILSYTAF